MSLFKSVLIAGLFFALFFEPKAMADSCDKPGPVMSFLSEVWFVTSETIKGAAKNLSESYKNERLMRDVAANRYEQLISEGLPIMKAIDVLEKEGLGPYLVSYAGRVPPMTSTALRKILERNGFRLLRTSGSHQILSDGAKSVVVPFHGNKDLGIGLINNVIKEAGLKSLFQ